METETKTISVKGALEQVFPEAIDSTIPQRVEEVLRILINCGWSEYPQGVSFEDLLELNRNEINLATKGVDLKEEARRRILTTEQLREDSARVRHARFHKPMTDIEVRGSIPQILTFGLPVNDFMTPRNIAREILDPEHESLLGKPKNLSASVLHKLQNGPDISLRIGEIPYGLYSLYEDELYSLDNRDDDLDTVTIVRQMRLNKNNDPGDHRKAMVIEFWDKNQKTYPNFTISISTRPEWDQAATDNRTLEGFDIEENSTAPVTLEDGEFQLHLPDPKRMWNRLEIAGVNSTQTVTRISRFLLDACLFGDDFLYESEPGELSNLKITDLVSDEKLFFNRERTNVFFHPAHYKDVQEDQMLIFNYKKREAEIVSRFMVAYMLDPYRFMAVAHSLDLLQFLPIGKIIEEGGGFDEWTRHIGKGAEGDSAEILTKLSDNYRRNVLPYLTPKASPWFDQSYIGLDGIVTNFSEITELLTPEFGRIDSEYAYYDEPDTDTVNDPANLDQNIRLPRKWRF